MAETDPLSDILTLFAAPLAGTLKSVEQFRKGVDEFLRGVENFNKTMENLNETAERINVMLGEVEEPLRVAIPQVTRTIQAADDVMSVVSGPAKAVAPGLSRLAEVLDNPAVAQMPAQLTQVNDLLGELTTRLAPLGQMAESAGGLFGGLRLPGFGQARPSPAPDDVSTPTDEQAAEKHTMEAVKKMVAAKQSAEDKTEEKPAAKKPVVTKKPATKKTAATKTAPKRKRAAKKKPAAKRAAKKTPARSHAE